MTNSFPTRRSSDLHLSQAGTTGQSIGNGLHLATQWDLRGGGVAGDHQIVLAVVTQTPLTANQRGLGDVLHRAMVPVDRADDGVQVGLEQDRKSTRLNSSH